MPSRIQIQSFTNIVTSPNVDEWSRTMSTAHISELLITNYISFTPCFNPSLLCCHSFESSEGESNTRVKEDMKNQEEI